MPCRFASSGTVATSRSASRAILALNAASNFLRDLVISVLHRLRQSRTLHTLTFGPISGVHFTFACNAIFSLCALRGFGVSSAAVCLHGLAAEEAGRDLLFRTLEASQIFNDRPDVLRGYRGLIVVDHLVDFRCPSLLRQQRLVQHHVS